MTPSKRVVFFGNERLVSGLKHSDTPVLKGLIAHEYDIVAIVASHTNATSRNARALEVSEIARQHNIPLLLPNKPGDIEQELRDLNADFAILSAYGRIIPQRVIDVFGDIGIINIHPSLLPKYRGSTPIESAILSGDDIAGVSIMQLTAGMDEGPVYAQRSIELRGDETKFELYDQLSTLGANLLLEMLPSIISGKSTPNPQRSDDASYTTMITKSSGIVDPLTDNATIIERKVRAYLGFPKSTYRYRDNDVIITSSKVIESPLENELCIPCVQNSTLLVESLIAPSGKSMSGSAYLRGLR